MKVYIAGPMTGLPNWNRAAFALAARRLRGAGWSVISPAELPCGDLGDAPEPYYARDLLLMLRQGVEAIALLPGWHESLGALTELTVAMTLGLKVLNARSLKEIPLPALCNAPGLLVGKLAARIAARRAL